MAAQAYQRLPERSGYANGFKPKKLDTPEGRLTVQAPKSRGGDAPFYPQALERGRRSSRAAMLAVAQMYILGISTRDVEKVMAELGLKSLSSSQVSCAATLMDAELEAWRTRPLGAFPYLFLDASLCLPAIHLVFSLAKRWLLGTHHGAVRPKHLQHYLDEFVFRFNRRKAKAISHGFARLIQHAVKTPLTAYRAIVHGAAA